MASVREVKNLVGHGSVRHAIAKLAMTRLTGLEPSRAIREAAHLMLKADLASPDINAFGRDSQSGLLVEWKSEVVGVARRVHGLEWFLAFSRYC